LRWDKIPCEIKLPIVVNTEHPDKNRPLPERMGFIYTYSEVLMSKVETIYLIHHSHTDVGYTHDQPIVWDLHERFIDEAVRLADKYAASGSDGAFRWTVENKRVLYEWLTRATRE
jgi:hypothetical protein